MLTKNKCIYSLKFKIDTTLLLDEWNKVRYKKEKFEDRVPSTQYNEKAKYTFEGIKCRTIHNDFPYAKFIKEKFHLTNFETKTKFYIMHPNAKLAEHMDVGTTCALNFLLSSDNAPVTFYDTDPILYENSSPDVREQILKKLTPYYINYTNCLINTSLIHGVTNGKTNRILFKINIKNEPFEKIREIIKLYDV